MSEPPLRSIDTLLFGFHPALDRWSMTHAERCAFIALLQAIRPACAIEIGTYQGGSLAVLARYAQHVYAIDSDPNCRQRLAPLYPDVSFVTGYSHEVLPRILTEIEQEERQLGFVLVDGDHRREGVRRDIELLLTHQPRCPLVIVMHDSFNPNCRQGILDVNWAANRFVQHVDIDYVPGILSDHPKFMRDMWNGFAVAFLAPQPRIGELQITQHAALTFQAALAQSIHGNRLYAAGARARYLMSRLKARLTRAPAADD